MDTTVTCRACLAGMRTEGDAISAHRDRRSPAAKTFTSGPDLACISSALSEIARDTR